jgi:hypothetical protein
MRVPARGEQLKSAKGIVWIVLRCHGAADAGFVAVDLIRQDDVQQTSRAVNLTSQEFEEFCRREGIVYPL